MEQASQRAKTRSCISIHAHDQFEFCTKKTKSFLVGYLMYRRLYRACHFCPRSQDEWWRRNSKSREKKKKNHFIIAVWWIWLRSIRFALSFYLLQNMYHDLSLHLLSGKFIKPIYYLFTIIFVSVLFSVFVCVTSSKLNSKLK